MPSMVRHQTGSRQKRHIKKTKSFGAWKKQTQKAGPTMLSEPKANAIIVVVIGIQTMGRDGDKCVQPRMQNAWIASRRGTSKIHLHVS